ncbi:unnamed protein product [Effrenium voratum]|nr:unnamed protein product [Effrenium voratum]
MAASWQSLLPREMEKSAMDSVVVQREEGEGYNSYQQFVGSGHLGQLTSLGHRQCRRSGEELRRRYPTASIRAFSTDFQRTIQSAASVLVGFGADAPVVVRAPRRQVLLPNYDGRCGRYVTRRAALLAAANGGGAAKMRQGVEAMLAPMLGAEPLNAVLDFTPFCVHQDVVGEVPGLSWEVAKAVEHYKAFLEAAAYSDAELLRLAAGRLVKEVMDCLAEPGHRITLLAAHDNMMTAFLIALGIYKEQWPLYASSVLIETASMEMDTQVRVLMNDEVCIDWQPLGELQDRLSGSIMSEEDYAAFCEA